MHMEIHFYFFLSALCNDYLFVLFQALTSKPDDKTCYVGRSKCYLKMGQSENALKDAEASLKEDKSYFEVTQVTEMLMPVKVVLYLQRANNPTPSVNMKSVMKSESNTHLFYSDLLQGLYQKAEALYYMGEFEFGLVFYHRGQKLRPQIQEFRLGIQKAQEAIENSVASK